MQIKRAADVPVEVPAGTVGVKMRWLIGAKDGAPLFAMRHFELAAGGSTPHHAHPWEHEVYVLAGQGTLVCESGERAFAAGDSIFIPGGEKHQFRNASPRPLEFLCMVPHPEQSCDPNDPSCCNGHPEKCAPQVVQIGAKTGQKT